MDLAGSERQASTGAVGARLKEAANINRSLMVLSTLISKLADPNRKKVRATAFECLERLSPYEGAFCSQEEVLPYRDSTLTKILKQSLGGNAATSILCCMSQVPESHNETVGTLNFGLKVGATRPVRSGVPPDNVDLADQPWELSRSPVQGGGEPSPAERRGRRGVESPEAV